MGRPERAIGSLLWGWGFIIFLVINALLAIVPMLPTAAIIVGNGLQLVGGRCSSVGH